MSLGDTVLVRQQKKNKLTPCFDPKPYEIIEIKGSMVTATRKGHTITRNSSFFKAIPSQHKQPARNVIKAKPGSTKVRDKPWSTLHLPRPVKKNEGDAQAQIQAQTEPQVFPDPEPIVAQAGPSNVHQPRQVREGVSIHNRRPSRYGPSSQAIAKVLEKPITFRIPSGFKDQPPGNEKSYNLRNSNK